MDAFITLNREEPAVLVVALALWVLSGYIRETCYKVGVGCAGASLRESENQCRGESSPWSESVVGLVSLFILL